MSQTRRYFSVPEFSLIALALLALIALLPVGLRAQNASAVPSTAPDANLYTNYYGSPTSVNWVVCGSTEESEGCYASGSLGPFVAVGAMLEGNPAVSGDVVTRYIYVVDAGASTATLYVYKKTDTVSSSSDTVVVSLFKTVPLSALVGGSGVTTYMAANPKYLYIGTSSSPQAVQVAKANLKVLEGGIVSGNVSSITSDAYGFITVTQGTDFVVYDPDGSYVEDGGGTQFMLSTTQAVPASSLLIGDAAPTNVRVTRKTPASGGQK
jgi:hypothetical protein